MWLFICIGIHTKGKSSGKSEDVNGRKSLGRLLKEILTSTSILVGQNEHYYI
jgi:hypothetical protein